MSHTDSGDLLNIIRHDDVIWRHRAASMAAECYDSCDVKKETLTRQSKNKSQYAGQRKSLLNRKRKKLTKDHNCGGVWDEVVVPNKII